MANKSLKLSANRLVFQSPGSGQEFAATMDPGQVEIFSAAQFLPLRLCSRSNCPQRIPRARPSFGTGAN